MLPWNRALYDQAAAHVVAASSTAASWDGLKDAGITLSNFNRTAVGNNASTSCVLSSAVVTTSQKVYYEIILDTRNASPRIGFATTGHVLTDTLGGDNPSTGFGLFLNTGLFADAGSLSVQLNSAIGTNGDRIGIAFDSGALKFWVRLNGGSWNVTVGGAQDPAAGTGGASVTAASGGLAWHGAYQSSSNDQITASFASGNLVDAVPTGFTLLAS